MGLATVLYICILLCMGTHFQPAIGKCFSKMMEEDVLCLLKNNTILLWPQLEIIDLDDIWFLHDGAICRTAREKLVLLGEKFDDRISSRNAETYWPPGSSDLYHFM